MNKRIKHILKLFIYHIGKILAKPQEKWLRAKNIFLNIDTVKKFKSCGTNFCIAPPFYLWYEQYMEIGDNFCSSPGLRMECIKEYNGTEYDAPQLIIGNNVSCNYYCHIGSLNKIVIDDKYILESISYDRLFPNTSLLFEMRQQSEYIIINKPILRELESDGKGGYNVFEAFVKNYLDIFRNFLDSNLISQSLYKKEIIISKRFIIPYFYNFFIRKESCNFKTDNGLHIMYNYFGRWETWSSVVKFILKNIKYKINNKLNFFIISNKNI